VEQLGGEFRIDHRHDTLTILVSSEGCALAIESSISSKCSKVKNVEIFGG